VRRRLRLVLAGGHASAWFSPFWRGPAPGGQSTQAAEQEQHEPMHGLKLVVKEEALPLREQPEFPALAELAKRGLLAPDTWNCKRAQISLKATIDVPMLGTIIEQNGDGLLEQSHMPVGWPLHIDGAVRTGLLCFVLVVCFLLIFAVVLVCDDFVTDWTMYRSFSAGHVCLN